MADTCPKCGYAGAGSDRCPQCGVVIPLYEASLEKMRRGPAPPGGAARAAGSGAAALAAPAAIAPEVAPFAEAGTVRRLTFAGSGGTLLGIQVVNAFLILLTLGVYYFWGKTRARAYLMSQTDFEDDRFVYHGTGRELLLGFLKATAVFFVPILLLNLLPDLLEAPREVKGTAALLIYALAMVFIPVAMVGARRYRLSRASWRGIRFSFRGPTLDFVKIFATGSILTALTLGIYYPFFITRRQAFMIGHSYFGSERFRFDGQGRDLLGPCLGAALLLLPTLGLSWFWFSARKQRYFSDHTSLSTARFRSTVTGRRLFGLTAGNVLLLIVTLGIALPWVIVRSLRFRFRYLSLEGSLDLDAIRQEAQVAGATGEGLSGFLDVDFGVG